jgi:3-deoxy-D-manno-octulosonate 8-phosphate phosphatase (KDO 8-P phosphatase)
VAARRNKAGRSARAAPKRAAQTLRTKLARARLVCLDVDGVLTDGRVVYGPRGREEELQHFHVQDGIAIEWLLQHGLAVVWISGRGSRATEARAKELGVSELHTRVKDKRLCLEDVQRRRSVDADETIVMGDDLPDLALLGACGLFAAPRNAVAEVRKRAGLVTRAAGGAGAVRELAQRILEARGVWSALVARSVR